jgi:hypothetical protein
VVGVVDAKMSCESEASDEACRFRRVQANEFASISKAPKARKTDFAPHELHAQHDKCNANSDEILEGIAASFGAGGQRVHSLQIVHDELKISGSEICHTSGRR